jgi:hypothetical protein
MADEILIETTTTEVLEVATVGPQGPKGDKGDPGDVAGAVDWDNITSKPSTFPPDAHTHTAAEITDFNTAVAAVAPPTTDASLLTSGTLNDARLSAAVTASLGKADTASQPGHTHTAADITDFTTAAAAAALVQSVAGRTGAVTLAVADVANAVADTDARLSDARTPIAHASSHHTGGTDAIAPNNIGAAWALETRSHSFVSTSTYTLAQGRNVQLNVTVSASNATGTVTLPRLTTDNAQNGDELFIVGQVGVALNTTLIIERYIWTGSSYIGSTEPVVTTTTSGAWRFRLLSGVWTLQPIQTHTHTATDISDSTTAGRALLTAADAAAQRTSLGLGSAAVEAASAFAAASHTHPAADITSGTLDIARVPTGTTSTTVALGNHTHELDALAATGITAGKILTADGDNTASWQDAPAGGATNLWIPASAWIPRTTGGCGVDSREIGATNRANVDELLFDTATEEFAQALVVMPNNYNNSTLTARFYWTAASGSGGVAWGLSGRAYGDDDALDQASGTRIVVTDTFITANDVHVTSATSAVTINGTPAANKAINFQISREVGNGSDTLAVDARLLGVEIIFN